MLIVAPISSVGWWSANLLVYEIGYPATFNAYEGRMKRLLMLSAAIVPMVALGVDTAAMGSNAEAGVKQRLLTYRVSPHIGHENATRLYYLTQNGASWVAAPTGDLTQENVERVAVNTSTGEITLDVLRGSRETGTAAGYIDKWECFQGLAGSGFRNTNNYSICSSNLAKGVTGAFDATIGSLNMLFGKVRRIMAVDQEKILAIAESSGLIDMIEQDIQVARTAEYHKLFALATTPSNIERFVSQYQGNDPEGLIPQAQARLQQAQLEQYRDTYKAAATRMDFSSFVDTYSKNDPDNLVPSARKRIREIDALEVERAKQEKIRNDLAAKQAAEQYKKEMMQLAVFRKSLADGDETNCGPVIESKGKLVKVSFAVSGYGNEHWIRRDEIYPASYGCRFVNGQYRAP